MSSDLTPYLLFSGQAREAMTFYADVLGGELTVTTMAEFGMGDGPAGERLMHSVLERDGRSILMGADRPDEMGESANGTIALFGDADDDARLRAQFDRLADGGEIQLPLEAAPWGDTYGQVADRFGVVWMVNISGQ